MEDDHSDRLVDEWLTNEVLTVADAALSDVDLTRADVEPVVWEGVSLGVNTEGGDHQVDAHKIYSDGISAESVKSSNISFNVHDLVQVLLSSAATVGAALAPTGGSQLLAATLALGVIHSVKMAATEELDVEDAAVFVAMHRGADGTIVTRSDLRAELDSFVAEIEVPVSISDDQLDRSLDRLLRIDAVEVLDVESEPRYRPIEDYSVTFDDDG
ncbi:hypothetical protein [Halosimplex amylolyticum]|uniref:hypothetical protein n=1 Tax=Halosimplex amylolyticum TaxID=3396616 RepID=UPI003F57CAC0